MSDNTAAAASDIVRALARAGVLADLFGQEYRDDSARSRPRCWQWWTPVGNWFSNLWTGITAAVYY